MNTTKVNNKKISMKSHHRKFKVLLSYVQSQYKSNEQQLIKDLFKKIANIHASAAYTDPIEWYIRKYKLNDMEENIIGRV